jgi:hypothetical protein
VSGGFTMSIKRTSVKLEETDRSGPAPSPDRVLDQVRLAIDGIRYGEIRVIIQDYLIVQIERVEKQRLR